MGAYGESAWTTSLSSAKGNATESRLEPKGFVVGKVMVRTTIIRRVVKFF